VSLDFGVQTYKRFDIIFGHSIVQFLYKIGVLGVTKGVSVVSGLRTELLSL